MNEILLDSMISTVKMNFIELKVFTNGQAQLDKHWIKQLVAYSWIEPDITKH